MNGSLTKLGGLIFDNSDDDLFKIHARTISKCYNVALTRIVSHHEVVDLNENLGTVPLISR